MVGLAARRMIKFAKFLEKGLDSLQNDVYYKVNHIKHVKH